MSVRVVTGYVRLDCQHRSHATYMQLAAQLLDTGIPLSIHQQRLEDCWLYRQSMPCNIKPDGKDSAAYHCVQHEKTAWIYREAISYAPAAVIWLDVGILHVPGVTAQHVRDFVSAVESSPPDRIVSPSCYAVPDVVPYDSVCWSFCGGVLVVPFTDAMWLHQQTVTESVRGQLCWEVNTWARVAQRHPEKFRLYAADHNERLFTGYCE